MVKDAVERQARSQRVWLDSALLQRRHREAMTRLGEIVHALAASGELGDLEEFPEIARQLAVLEDLEERIVEAGERAREATERARDAAERFVERAAWPATEGVRRAWEAGAAVRGGRRGAPTGAAGMPMDDEDPFDVDPFDDEPPPTPSATARAETTRRSPRRPPPRPRRTGGIEFVDDEPDDGSST